MKRTKPKAEKQADSIYDGYEELLEDDEIDAFEAGFMSGYHNSE